MPPTIRPAPPAARLTHPPVCPILTLGILAPPSALVTAAPQSIQTVPCLGPRCAFFHAAGACSVLVAGDALLAQAHAMVDEEKPDGDAAPTGTPS